MQTMALLAAMIAGLFVYWNFTSIISAFDIRERAAKLDTAGTGVSIEGTLHAATIDGDCLVRFEGRITNQLAEKVDVTWLRVQTFTGTPTHSDLSQINEPPNRLLSQKKGAELVTVAELGPIEWAPLQDWASLSDKPNFNDYGVIQRFPDPGPVRGGQGAVTLDVGASAELDFQWVVKSPRANGWFAVILSLGTKDVATHQPIKHLSRYLPFANIPVIASGSACEPATTTPQ